MTETIRQVTSWQTLLVLLAVSALYGIAPGATLRLTVRMYRADHPRRRELIAELYAIPRRHRPIWVLEQLETALAEGLAPRVREAWRQPFQRLAILFGSGTGLFVLSAALLTSGAPEPFQVAAVTSSAGVMGWAVIWANLLLGSRRMIAWGFLLIATAMVTSVLVSLLFGNSLEPHIVSNLWALVGPVAIGYGPVAWACWRYSAALERRRVRMRRAEHRRRIRRQRDRVAGPAATQQS